MVLHDVGQAPDGKQPKTTEWIVFDCLLLQMVCASHPLCSGGDRLAGSMIVEAPRCLQGRLPMVARLHDGVLLPASLWLHPLCSGGVSLA